MRSSDLGLIFVCFLGMVGFGFFAARAIRNNPGARDPKFLPQAIRI